MSLKKTNSAERISPIPKLKSTRHAMGYRSSINFQVNGIPSKKTKKKKIRRVNPKLIREDTFFEKRNKYLGTFILLKIAALLIKEFIPLVVDSL